MTSVSRCSSCSQLAKFVDNHCYKIGGTAVVTGAIAATLCDPLYTAAGSAIAATGVIASIAKYMRGPSALQGRVTEPPDEDEDEDELPPLVDVLPEEYRTNPQNLILLYQQLGVGPRFDDNDPLEKVTKIWCWMNKPGQQKLLQEFTTLNLIGCGLTALPSVIGLFLFPNITTFCLSDNELEVLPPEIGQLTALKSLSLDENKLKALPREIGQLTALEELDLENNNLKALPPEIGQLTALKELDLATNNIKALPPEIGRLKALKKLYLKDNELNALPPEIGGLTALESLSLEGNELKALPPEIGGLTALESLSLEGNELNALPPEIEGLTALKSLSLQNRLLKTLPQGLRRKGLEIIGSDNISRSGDELE